MRRSNSGHSLQQGEGRTNGLGENLAENNNGMGNGLGNGLGEEVKESNGWDGGRASITISPHRCAIRRFQNLS